MDKNEKTIYYERKLIAYEQTLNTYWEIISQIVEGSMTSLDYFQTLKGTLPGFLYCNIEVNKKKEALEPCFLELAQAKNSKKSENSISYTKAYNKLNKAFNDLIMAMREDVEGVRNDSSISETADR